MGKVVLFSLLCLSGSLLGAGASGNKVESVLFGAAAGVHGAVLLFALFTWLDKRRPNTPDAAQPAKPPKSGRFVSPHDDTFTVAVPSGADVAAAVARYAAERGLEAYQSATQGFLLSDRKRQKVYRTRIQLLHA
jgi:hypothetical protein